MPKKLRVIQYATGVTGRIAIQAMADHPELELVGDIGRRAGSVDDGAAFYQKLV